MPGCDMSKDDLLARNLTEATAAVERLRKS
jgi:hypothetical protein